MLLLFLSSEEDLLEFECKTESSNTESCLRGKSDFSEDELLRLDREYDQKYVKDDELDDAPEDKPKQVLPQEKEEVVKRKIIKLNTSSSKLCYSSCFMFGSHISQSTTIYHHYLVVVILLQLREAKNLDIIRIPESTRLPLEDQANLKLTIASNHH